VAPWPLPEPEVPLPSVAHPSTGTGRCGEGGDQQAKRLYVERAEEGAMSPEGPRLKNALILKEVNRKAFVFFNSRVWNRPRPTWRMAHHGPATDGSSSPSVCTTDGDREMHERKLPQRPRETRNSWDRRNVEAITTRLCGDLLALTPYRPTRCRERGRAAREESPHHDPETPGRFVSHDSELRVPSEAPQRTSPLAGDSKRSQAS
jgi:hypothetical protein